MTYLLLAAGFIAVGAAVLLVVRWRTRRGGSAARVPGLAQPSGRVLLGTVVVLAALTFVFDNLMIAAGLFTFGAEHLVGVYVGRAPIEDLSYPIATALLLPALWTLLGARRDRR